MRWREEEEGGRLCGRIGSADGNICSPEGAAMNETKKYFRSVSL